MTQILRQSTSIKVRIGPFVDKTDGVTPETGVTLGAADQAEILKADGAATSAMAGTFAAVTGADGWYDYTLSTGDTDTVGTLDIVVQDASVCLPVMARFQVVEESVYDALFAASATGIPTAAAIRTEIDSNSTQLAAILTDTGTTLDANITAIKAKTDSLTFTVANQVDSNAIAISGDTAAADSLEAMLDGTGDTLTLDQLVINSIDALPNIVLGGSGSADGIAFTRAGTGDPFDANFMAQLNAEMDTSISDAALATASALATVDTNVDAILVDTGTTLPATLAGTLSADMVSISGSTTAADNLEASTLGIVATTVNDVSATTTSFVITSSEATDDHFNGRVIVFTSGALANQACAITDYVGATKTVTVTALTEAPANGVTLVIV